MACSAACPPWFESSMQLRIAQFHDVAVYEALVGIVRQPPGRAGGRVPHWRLEPGWCPVTYGAESWGDLDLVSGYWNKARPVLWEVDVGGTAGQPLAVFASGILTGLRGQWCYHEAPGGDPVLLAASRRGDQLSILARSPPNERPFPILVPAERASEWVRGPVVSPDTLAMLPPMGAALFRSWPIGDPTGREDSPDVIAPLLD